MRYLYIFLFMSFSWLSAGAQCTNLFFSEYIEGSGNNKALEIFNPTTDTIDLTAYQIDVFNNGGTTASNTFNWPAGKKLAPKAVYVIANSGASLQGILDVADTTSAVTFYNGDDAVVLSDTVNQVQIDIIGIVGSDPGANWPVGSGATSEFTLLRKQSVNDGTTDWSTGANQWDVYARDFIDSLGSHSILSCEITVNPIASFVEAAKAFVEDNLTDTIHISLVDIDANYQIIVKAELSSTATSEADYSLTLDSVIVNITSGQTSAVIPYQILEDVVVEPTEYLYLKMTTTTPGLGLGNDELVITIFDDDTPGTPPCTQPFFSEYLEGSGNNKALEIFNPTDSDLDMSGYRINRFNNGGTDTSGTFTWPAGYMLASGKVYVIGNSMADSSILDVSDTTSTITFFNGDDALQLEELGTSTVVDVIGIVGDDPGNSWPAGTGTTGEHTLVRMSSVRGGQSNWNVSSSTWIAYDADFTDSLGSHYIEGCDIEPDPCDGVTINLSFNVTDETAAGAGDGAIDLTVSGGTSPYNYSWSSGQTTEDISGLDPATYIVTVTDQQNCGASGSAIVDAGPTGVFDSGLLEVFTLQPNPSRGDFRVDIRLIEQKDMNLRIIDPAGRTVYASLLSDFLEGSIEISVDLESGIYFLNLSAEDSSVSRRMVIIR